MSEIIEGAIYQNYDHVELPALNYALVKLELDKKSFDDLSYDQRKNAMYRTTALAFYLQNLYKNPVPYSVLAGELREHDLYHSYGKMQDSDYWKVQENIAKLYEHQVDDMKKQVLLTKDAKGTEWNRSIEDQPEEFIKMIYPDAEKERDQKYFKYVVENYQAHFNGFDVSGRTGKVDFDKGCAEKAVNEILQGDLKKQRGLHYIALMAYQSRHKMIELEANLDDVTMYVKARDLEIETQKREQERQEKNEERVHNGCMTSFVLAAAAAVCFVAYKCDGKDKKEQELKQQSKEVVLPQEAVNKEEATAQDTVQFVNDVMKNPARKLTP